MRSLYKRVIIGLVAVTIIVGARLSGVSQWLNLDYIRSHTAIINVFIDNHYLLSVMSYILLCAVCVTLTIPLTVIFSLASGFFFGVVPGSLYSVCGSTLGATASFLLFRYLLQNYVKQRYGGSLEAFNKELREHGSSYLLTIVLLPLTPFAIVNILSGLSDIPLLTFGWAVALGTLPGTLIYAFAGKQLMNIEKSSDIWSWQFIIALMVLALISLIPLLVRLYKNRKNTLRENSVNEKNISS